MKKLQKFSTVSLKIANILIWVLSIIYAVVALGVFILLVGRSSLLAPPKLSIGFLNFALDPNAIHFIPKHIMLLAMLYLTWAFGISIYILVQLKKIFRATEGGAPFHCQVGSAIRRIAFSLLLNGIVLNIIPSVFSNICYHIYNMDTLFCNASIQGCTVSYDFDFGFIFEFCLLFLLSYVFQYGAELQTLSDETL